MSIGIGDNLGKSFGFAKDSLVGKWLNWLLLIILTIIPIVDFIAFGTYLKIFRGEAVKIENVGKSFVDGLLWFIISLIYMIVPIILASVLGVGAVLATGLTGNVNVVAGAGIGAIALVLIVTILFSLLLVPATINFANHGFGAAFAFGKIFEMIGKAGWIKFIVSVILLGIIFAVIGLVIGFIGLIPVVGSVLSWILYLIILPFLFIWEYKYMANLFA